ncbi:Chaperone for flagella basal body P-ring formation [Klenkia marina]|uniref:Chaperone for flagella basal body P-ring formation n=1 Tax=Klenkia marina TaxID=1960309 RepID=A0A1G4YF20_9ACTN|nr:SAF domain-containing protein [Klenkia marina]SCX51964.1 Chaperone for flagella basal body P-ring formation [Klenkia marina]
MSTRTPSAVAPAGPEGPVPRRVRPPRWLDLRLVFGVLLVLGSVLIGARVVSAADATVPVWSATGDLAAGTVLAADDLVAAQVRLDDAAGGYLATTTDPVGQVLGRAVGGGELLPRSALYPASEDVQLALPVQAGYAPPALARGQLVDVYAVADPAAGATDVSGDVDLVVGGATVQAVTGRGDGVLSTSATTIQVVVGVPAEDVPAVLAAVGGRALVVVVRDGVDTGRTAGPATPTVPAGTPTTPPAGPTG